MQVWAEWAEMLIQHNKAGKALELMRRASKRPEGRKTKLVRVSASEGDVTILV